MLDDAFILDLLAAQVGLEFIDLELSVARRLSFAGGGYGAVSSVGFVGLCALTAYVYDIYVLEYTTYMCWSAGGPPGRRHAGGPQTYIMYIYTLYIHIMYI